MGKINQLRVLSGGLLAGVVLLLGSFLLQTLFMNEAVLATFEELGARRLEGMWLFYWILFHFIVGISVIALYAIMRPRLGSGPWTAVRAGLAFWFLSTVLPVGALGILGLYPSAVVGVSTLIPGAIGIPLATVVGAWIYREDDPVPA